jgi:AcrR family transcriptional regulator
MIKPNKRQISKAATRDKAVQAALKLWSVPGSYEDHGIREIAHHMSMSTGAIFANFESKADLWRAAFDCDAPVDSVLTRAAPALFKALESLIEIRPEVARETQSGVADSWLEAEAIIERIKDQLLDEERPLHGAMDAMPAMDMAA